MLPDLLRRSLRQHATVAQHANALRDLEDDIHVVLDEHQRHLLAFPQAVHRVDHLPAFLRPHAGRRLIEQQNAWFEHQGERDIEKLLVAVAEVARHHIGLRGQADHLHDLLRACAATSRSGKRPARPACCWRWAFTAASRASRTVRDGKMLAI